MITSKAQAEPYEGFEQGPIRPPSEAHSLLIRVTRNCPWNRCAFCPVYKGTSFSVRPVDHVKRDIDAVHKHVNTLGSRFDGSLRITQGDLQSAAEGVGPQEHLAFAAALNWLAAGREPTVFLQDADALATKTSDVVAVLEYVKTRFPSVERITSYSRARTIGAKKEQDLAALKAAGLTRLHVGLESGSDQVLELMKKGVTKEQQIAAGLKVKRAGIELSEYVMPGLGGQDLSRVHALDTADALNRIDPDFIRLRTLAIVNRAPLFLELGEGRFTKCTDLQVAEELLLLVENLGGITGIVQSDHVLNLFADLEGNLPHDQARMISMLRAFLRMDPHRQRLYQLGRRRGMVCRLAEMDDARTVAQIEQAYRRLGVNEENLDEITDAMMARYV